MGAYHKPYEEAEIRMKLEPIAKVIAESENGMELIDVHRMLHKVNCTLSTLTFYYPIYEETRKASRGRRDQEKLRTFIYMLKK